MNKLKNVEKLFALSIFKEMLLNKLLSKDEYFKCVAEFEKIMEKRENKNE